MSDYVPDNYDAFERHEAAQEARLAKRPKCAYCKHPIQDEFLYVINEELYCEECLNDLFRESTEDYEN